MIYNNFERRYFLFRESSFITIYEFDSNTEPKFLLDSDYEMIKHNADTYYHFDKMFLPKIKDQYKIFEIDLDFNIIIGSEFEIIKQEDCEE